MQIIAIGYGFDYPPAGLPGMTRFMDSLNVPEVSEVSTIGPFARRCLLINMHQRGIAHGVNTVGLWFWMSSLGKHRQASLSIGIEV